MPPEGVPAELAGMIDAPLNTPVGGPPPGATSGQAPPYAAAPAAAAAVPAIPDFLTIEGQAVPLNDVIQSYQNAASMRADYTRKTQELSELKEFGDFMTANPDYADAFSTFNQSWEQQVNGQQPNGAPAQQQNDPLAERLDFMENGLMHILEQGEATRLKGVYSDFDLEAVQAYTVENRMPSLEAGYKAMQFDRLPDLIKAGQQDIIKGIQSGRRAALEGSGVSSASASSGETPKPPQTWAEANQRMKAALDASRAGSS